MSDASLELRDVRGPSALGGGWRRAADLLYLIAVTEFRRSYLGTALGYVWSLARPLLLFGVLLLVFTKAFDLGERVNEYPVLLLFNIVLFGFFQEATVMAVGSIVAQEPVVRKTQFPRVVIPLAVVLTALFNLGMTLIAVFIFAVASGVYPDWGWLELPVIIVLLTFFATGVGLLLSALFVRYRDVQPIWEVFSQLLFYASPVLYVATMVPESYQRAYLANPIAALLTEMRHAVVDPTSRPVWEAIGAAPRLLIPTGIVVAVFVLGLWVFRRESPRIAENL
jgi:ABC-2 type transport system permease protein